MIKQGDEIIIDFRRILRYLLRHLWVVILAVMLGGGVCYGICTFYMTPEYRSQTLLYIMPKSAGMNTFSEVQVSNAMATDMVEIATSNPVLDQVIEIMDETYKVQFTRADIRGMISVTNRFETRILQITATSYDPYVSEVVANKVREAVAAQMSIIMKTDIPETIEIAEPNFVPIGPKTKRNTALGGGVAGAVVMILLVLLCISNTRLKTVDDIEAQLGLKVLVVIQKDRIFEHGSN